MILIYEKHLEQALISRKSPTLVISFFCIHYICRSGMLLTLEPGAVILHLGHSNVPRLEPLVPLAPLTAGPGLLEDLCGDRHRPVSHRELSSCGQAVEMAEAFINTLLDPTPFPALCPLVCLYEREARKARKLFS